MSSAAPETGFTIWGVDQSPYGPVELPTLVSWIKDERVLADTWVFSHRDSAWRRASDITELQMFFRRKATHAAAPADVSGLKVGVLRRMKSLGTLTDPQLSDLPKRWNNCVFRNGRKSSNKAIPAMQCI